MLSRRHRVHRLPILHPHLEAWVEILPSTGRDGSVVRGLPRQDRPAEVRNLILVSFMVSYL